MLSFKRFLYLILIIAVLGGIFLIYSIYDSSPANAQIQSCLAPERDFTETRPVEAGEKPRVFLLGEAGEGCYGEIYNNVRQFCEDLHLTVAGEGAWDVEEVREQDLVVFCDAAISRYTSLAELESFIARGGRVILAAGLAEGDGEVSLPAFGIQEKFAREDFSVLDFEKPLFPVQPEQVYYEGSSGSIQITVSAEASVYLRAAGSGVPLLYTYGWQKGSICLINGTFLRDIRYMGLFSGSICALLPDFLYPVLGVKAVFLDHFPMMTASEDELCRRLYGYSVEGFLRDMVWPTFQGVSLRTDTPYTSSLWAIASSAEGFEAAEDALFTTICKSALQFGGELIYAADCPEEGKVAFHEELARQFSATFPHYTIQGLALKTGSFSPEMLEVPGAEIRSVRGMLGSPDTRLSWEEGRTVFPAATMGNSITDGNLFAIYSVLGAYGLVSHVFDIDKLITGEGETATWDVDRTQIGFLESEVLSRVSWLEGRTLTQTEGDVKSYQELDYGWIKNGNCIEFCCSGAAKGQTFFYHTDSQIADAKGLDYEAIGNGYYLLRIEENEGSITLEEVR